MKLAWACKGDIHRCCDCDELRATTVYRGVVDTECLYPLCKGCVCERYNWDRLMSIEEAQIMIVKSKL